MSDVRRRIKKHVDLLVSSQELHDGDQQGEGADLNAPGRGGSGKGELRRGGAYKRGRGRESSSFATKTDDAPESACLGNARGSSGDMDSISRLNVCYPFFSALRYTHRRKFDRL